MKKPAKRRRAWGFTASSLRGLRGLVVEALVRPRLLPLAVVILGRLQALRRVHFQAAIPRPPARHRASSEIACSRPAADSRRPASLSCSKPMISSSVIRRFRIFQTTKVKAETLLALPPATKSAPEEETRLRTVGL